jgi:hypothetical protein
MLTPGALAIAPYACVKEPEPESVEAAFCPAEFIEKTSLVTPECTNDWDRTRRRGAIVLERLLQGERDGSRLVGHDRDARLGLRVVAGLSTR